MVLGVFTLLSCQRETVPQPQHEQPVVKTVTFHVFAGEDYSGAHYAQTKADVKLELRMVDLRTGAVVLVWDTAFAARPLSEYPQHGEMYIVEKSYPVLESAHKLNAGYGIKYDTNGMLMQEGYGEDLIQGVKNLRLEADL